MLLNFVTENSHILKAYHKHLDHKNSIYFFLFKIMVPFEKASLCMFMFIWVLTQYILKIMGQLKSRSLELWVRFKPSWTEIREIQCC